MSRTILTFFLTYVAANALGCAQLCDCLDTRIIECRDKHRAHQSWQVHQQFWAGECHMSDFKKGFQDGYFSVMQGKGSHPPTLPPRKYWSSLNMGPDCNERTLAWFNGFHAGGAAAVGDGMENHCRIATSELMFQQNACQANVDWSNPVIEESPIEAIPGTIEPPETNYPPTNLELYNPAIEEISPVPVLESSEDIDTFIPSTSEDVSTPVIEEISAESVSEISESSEVVAPSTDMDWTKPSSEKKITELNSKASDVTAAFIPPSCPPADIYETQTHKPRLLPKVIELPMHKRVKVAQESYLPSPLMNYLTLE